MWPTPTTTKQMSSPFLVFSHAIAVGFSPPPPQQQSLKLKLLLLLLQVVLLPTKAKFKTEAFTVVVAGGAVAHNSKV